MASRKSACINIMKNKTVIHWVISILTITYLIFLASRPINTDLMTKTNLILIRLSLGILITIVVINLPFQVGIKWKKWIDYSTVIFLIIMMILGIFFSSNQFWHVINSNLCSSRKTGFSISYGISAVILCLLIIRLIKKYIKK